MTRAAIRKLAEAKIKEGKSRQEVFDELSQELSENKERIAKIVRYRIPLKTRAVYSNLFYVFVGLVIVSIILKLLGGFFLISILNLNNPLFYLLAFLVPIGSIILLIQALNHNGSAFGGIAGINAYGIFSSIKNLDKIEFNVITGIEFVFILSLIGLSIFLSYKMVPNYEMKATYENTNEGLVKSTSNYKFVDVKSTMNHPHDDELVI